jgi:hypothetical protein
MPADWVLASGAGAIVWTYLGLIAARWDQYNCPAAWLLGSRWLYRVVTFLVWWIVIPIYWSVRPPKSWRITDPPPSAVERVKLAQERSETMERECGLVFDEVVLLPGYKYDDYDEYEAGRWAKQWSKN